MNTAILSNEATDAIGFLLCCYNSEENKVEQTGDDLLIHVEHCGSYDRFLTLTNVHTTPELTSDYISFIDDGEFYDHPGKYCLTGAMVNTEDNTTTPIAIYFTDAKVDITISKAGIFCLIQSPWEYLQIVAYDILAKDFLPGCHLGEAEKELLPLILEIAKLHQLTIIPYELSTSDFTQLKFYVNKYGFDKISAYLEKIEKEKFRSKKQSRLIKKMVRELNTKKCEPLWREFFDKLMASQSSYAPKADIYCGEEALSGLRAHIQSLMEQHGYSGTYPDFTKTKEKKVVCHIHCVEEFFGVRFMMVGFWCGIEFLTDNEKPGDIFSCLFNTKGRRFFKVICYETEYISEENKILSDDLDTYVQIAAKKAELLKLSKDEKKRCRT